jgi:lipopolysaccharide biosynthesis glycosyltransferase
VMEYTVACNLDERYAQHCAVMLCSLFVNNPQAKFRIYLLTDGLKGSSARRLRTICTQFGHLLVITPVDTSVLSGARVSPDDHVSLATYYRILLPKLLPLEVDKALFLDGDLIARRSIAEFYNQRLDNETHAAVPDPLGVEGIKIVCKRLGMPEGALYFNAGVLLLNIRLWRVENISERVLEHIKTHREKLEWWDQDALNAVLHSRWKACPAKWNAQPALFRNYTAAELNLTDGDYREAVDNPCIVHFAGPIKPWMSRCTHPLKAEYYEYLRLTPWKRFRPADRPRTLDRLKRRIKRLAGHCAARILNSC